MTIVRSLLKNVCLLLLLVAVPAVAQGQDPAQDSQQATSEQQQPQGQQSEGEQSQDQDVRYTAEEYAAYQKATEEPDPAKREDAIIAFVKANPNSSLVQYAVTSYLNLLLEYQKASEWQKLIAAGEKLLAIKPDDVQAMYLTGAACFYTQQNQKAATYLEKVYEQQPEPQIAFMLASIYGSPGTNDDDKLVKYGEIACSKFEPKDCYQILTGLMRVALVKKQWDKAAEYAKQTLQGFQSVQKPAAVSQAEWDEYVARERAIAYSALGRQAFETQNMKAAISNYKQSLKTFKKNPNLNAEAYYHIGLAMWTLDPASVTEGAMVAFAKGAQEKGAPHQKPCQEQLEHLYKQLHNGSLAGLDEFVEEALTKQLPSD
ncbi:MAG TPA: hypothetical protein PLP42_03885 [Acidobacteriota bacterium]|nr:hypothetical protein [Acidobacteriota bacterium]